MKLAGPVMPRVSPRAARAMVAALGLVWAGEARAQQGAADRAALAQGLYDSAAELIKAGRHAQACPKLEESQRLDPAIGTQFFLAACYEQTGRLTTAWSLFLEVAAAAKAAGNGVRETTAHARAAALEPRLPRLRIVIGGATVALPGLTVSRDGVLLKPVAYGAPIPVDLGEHVVRVEARAKLPWEIRVTVREPGQKVEVTIPALEDAPPGALAPSPPGHEVAPPPLDAAQAAPRGLGGQRIAAIVVGVAGVGGIAAGTALGLMAKSAWNDATTECPTRTGCSSSAHDASDRTLSLATGSTVAFVVGGVAVAGAVVLWAVAPSPRAAGPSARVVVAPVVGPGVAGASFSGGF